MTEDGKHLLVMVDMMTMIVIIISTMLSWQTMGVCDETFPFQADGRCRVATQTAAQSGTEHKTRVHLPCIQEEDEIDETMYQLDWNSMFESMPGGLESYVAWRLEWFWVALSREMRGSRCRHKTPSEALRTW